MALRRDRRRLIVNGDDFGRSTSINEAIRRAHCEGILTTASLMVGGEAFHEAVEIALSTPSLGVGLHLTLVCGSPVSSPSEIPGLVTADGRFSNRAAWTGFRYWALPRIRTQLRIEIAAQFERFRSTGIPLDHVNGHLHLHLHPLVSDVLCEHAGDWAIHHMRLSRDSLALSLRTTGGRWWHRLSHALIFGALVRRARPQWDRCGIRYVDLVVGIHADNRLDEACWLRLLPLLPEGDIELFAHPSLDHGRHELDALISPRVKQTVDALGIARVRYQDL